MLSDEQCKARDARRKSKQRVTTPKKMEPPPPTPVPEAFSPECNVIQKSLILEPLQGTQQSCELLPLSALPSTTTPYSVKDSQPIMKVSEDTAKLVEKLVRLQDKYEFPEESKVERALVSAYNNYIKGDNHDE